MKSKILTLALASMCLVACLQEHNIAPNPTPTPTPVLTPTPTPFPSPANFTLSPAQRFKYGNDDIRQHVDFYTAVEDPNPRPLFIFIHGGAWVFGGDPTSYDSSIKVSIDLPMRNLTQNLINNGFSVGIMKYRHPKYYKKSSPVANVPMEQSALYNIMQDINSAFGVLLSQASALKIDPTRLGLMGDSAGAHLATLYAYGYGNMSHASQLKTVVPLYGVFDMSKPDAAPAFYSYPYNGINPTLFVASIFSGGRFGNPLSEDEDNDPLTFSIYLARAFDCLTGQFFATQNAPERKNYSPVGLIDQKGASNLTPTFVISAANDAVINANQFQYMKSALNAQSYDDALLASPNSVRHMAVNVPGFNHGFMPITAGSPSAQFDQKISPMLIHWLNARLRDMR